MERILPGRIVFRKHVQNPTELQNCFYAHVRWRGIKFAACFPSNSEVSGHPRPPALGAAHSVRAPGAHHEIPRVSNGAPMFLTEILVGSHAGDQVPPGNYERVPLAMSAGNHRFTKDSECFLETMSGPR